MNSLIAIILAYLIGSLSFAVIVSKAMGLPDPHSYGSGNPGATNVLRTGKKLAAILTLLGDAGKGWFALWLAQKYAAPIVPIHAHFSSAWRLKTWDRLVIPKPFSRVTVIFDERLVVPPKLDEAAFQHQLERVQAILLTGTDDS